ncbi:PREDICTED: rho GTPase-activating protein gacZ-like, partial [Rhagoletis zephyria]|uniref:rho GTPase-activating protein gacZ-like n=1 Tax=Rhagoletis zephyria TaxID=28612 RepID=UPI0008112C63
DLRKKNWKLVEALQSAETTARQNKAPKSANESLVQQQQLFAASQKQQSSSATANAARTVSAFEEKHIREIFQRLYPEAAKACASTALSASFEQWVEQVLATQLKLTTASKAASSSSNKSTQSSSSNSSSSNHTPSTHTNNNSHNDNLTNNSNNRISNNSTGDGESSGSGGGGNDIDAVELRLQNTQLRAKVDELTKLVTKTVSQHRIRITFIKECACKFTDLIF